MSDSNEIKNDQKHPRLRLPQAGVKAQEDQDAGIGVTTTSMIALLHNELVDYMNGRADRDHVLTVVQASDSIAKHAALELKNREMIYRYEQNGETPAPLQLVADKRSNAKTKRAS